MGLVESCTRGRDERLRDAVSSLAESTLPSQADYEREWSTVAGSLKTALDVNRTGAVAAALLTLITKRVEETVQSIDRMAAKTDDCTGLAAHHTKLAAQDIAVRARRSLADARELRACCRVLGVSENDMLDFATFRTKFPRFLRREATPGGN